MRLFATSLVALATAMVFAVTASTAPAHAAAPTQNQQQKVHTVASGDTLDKIAQANGTNYLRLFNANMDISDPDVIFVDQKVRIPSADEKLADRAVPGDAVAVTESAPAAPAPAVVVTPAPAPSPAPAASAAPAVAGGSVWDQLALCESGGNWSINTGNGFYGGIQFTLSSWQAVGGTGMPNQASREEQIMRGQMLQARQGWGAWPACAAKLGLL